MGKRLLLLPLLATVAFAAAGCGAGAPTSFAACGRSYSHGTDAIYPTEFDCLARRYRAGCPATKARIVVSGVDTGTTYEVRMYRRGRRCVGEVTAQGRMMAVRHAPITAGCRQAYLLGKTMTLFQCGKLGDLALVRGHDCRAYKAQLARRFCRRTRSAGYCSRKIPVVREPLPFAC